MKRLVLGFGVFAAWLLAARPAAADYIWVRVNVSQIGKVVDMLKGGPVTATGAAGASGMMGVPMKGGFMGSSPPPGMMGGSPGMMGMMGMPPPPPVMMGGVGMMGVGMMGGLPEPPKGGVVLPGEPGDTWAYSCLSPKNLKPRAVGGVNYLSVMDLEPRWGAKSALSLPFFSPPPSPATLAYYQAMSQILSMERVPGDSFAAEFAKKAKKGSNAALATYALQHGMMKEFHQTMEEVGKAEPGNATYKAYVKLKADLKKAPPADPSLKDVEKRLKEEKFARFARGDDDPGHYAIYHKLTDKPSNNDLLRRRIARLEETLESFYYWFVATDRPPPSAPKHQLLVVLVDLPLEFQERQVYWGQPRPPFDGFTARRDNILFLSAQRTDRAFTELDDQINELKKVKIFAGTGLTPEQIISPDLWKNKTAQAAAAPFALLQLLLVIHRSMEEDGDRATLTHEATRQLIVASDMVPRGVKTPEWLLVGLASYFETPLAAPYVSIGAPSWSHAVAFSYFKKKRKIEDKDVDKQAQLLLDVLTDQVFRDAKRMHEDLKEVKDREAQEQKVRQEYAFARAASWALVYYLIKEEKMKELNAYRDELAKLPRDLDLDEKVLSRIFASAFGKDDKKSEALALDMTALKIMAREWSERLSATPVELPFFEREGMRILDAADQPKKGPPPPTAPGTGVFMPGVMMPPPPPIMGGR